MEPLLASGAAAASVGVLSRWRCGVSAAVSAPRVRVIEKQIDEELLARYLETVLSADESEAGSELEQKSGNMPHQRVFDLSLLGLDPQPQEVEQLRVLQRLVREVGMRRS